MSIRINLGGLFSLLFGRKKKNKDVVSTTAESQEAVVNWEPMTADAVLNCCEQIGAFEEMNLNEGDAVINAICESVSKIFNEKTKNAESLKAAFKQGFAEHGFTVSDKQTSTFVDCYLSSYVYE